MMNRETAYRQALKEVYVILNNMSLKDVSKIPLFVIKFLEENADAEYIPDISFSEPLNFRKLKPKTIKILSRIYSLYWKDKK